MINIDKGETKVFTIDLRLKNGRPFDLTGYDVLKIGFIKDGENSKFEVTQDGTENDSLVEILGNPVLGVIQVTINKADSAAFTAKEQLFIDLEIDKSGSSSPIRERFVNALNIVDSVLT